MKERIVPSSKWSPYISAWGNENIIWNHVKYFEKELEVEIAKNAGRINVDLTSSHNFAAWIRLYTELICNSLFWQLFRYEGDWDKIIDPKNKYGFGKVRDIIIEKIEIETKSISKEIPDTEIVRMKKLINLILNLRHSFNHGGLPNCMRELCYKTKEEEFTRMLNPNNYKDTKKIFVDVYKFIKKLPTPTVKG